MVPSPAAPDPPPRPLPLVGCPVPAGFPSPADDYLEGEIDLNRYLIERPAATYLMRVAGRSMAGAGIMDGDLAVVDRSVEAVPGHVVVALAAGDLVVRRLRRTGQGRMVPAAEGPGHPPIEAGGDDAAEIWGVVVGVARRMRPGGA